MSGAYLSTGAVLGNRWEIERELGRGGYSVVYLARDRQLGTKVALKLLVPPPAAAELARERMRREVQAVRGLSHENIVAVYDFVEEGPWSFILMEYIAGPDLHVRVRERGALTADQAVRLGRDIAAALGTAHRHGILHRDVKPQNVLLDPDGRYRLTDFGSARLDGQLGVTTTGALTGTPDYTAPEILCGRRGDARSDIYALGLTLYFALTGELPAHEGTDSADAGAGHHPRQVTPAIPDWLDDIVARATAASPEDRFPTASAFDQALSLSVADTPSPTPRCLLCSGPDPLGLGLCPACGGDGESSDSLVYLQRLPHEARVAAESRLTSVLPAVAAEARSAIRGERPLFRASTEGAERIVEVLARRDLPARVVSARLVLTELPVGFFLMLSAVVVAGTAAGIQAAPTLRWVTPLFAGLLVVSARRVAATPLVSPRVRATELPAEVARPLLSTLAELPPGTARDLLADLTRMGQSLYARLRRSGDTGSSATVLGELLVASASAASDLALLDANLGRFERQRERLAARPSGSMDALGRCERARDALVQRLLEAMTVLGQLQGQTADLAAAESGLADSITELRAEAEARAAAAKEIEALLGAPDRRRGGTAELR
ncbi:MAG TPA: protein kinase [Gemmatimonadales bacterium]|jgi:predicted Ser/Thr protein kinase